MSFLTLVSLGLLGLFIYLQIGRMISAACWNYWDRSFQELGCHTWYLSSWRARQKSVRERLAIFLLYPVTSALKKDDETPPIADWLFSKKHDAPVKLDRMRSYLLCSSPFWLFRLLWGLVVALFLALRACGIGVVFATKYMMLARVERLPILAAERLRTLRPRRPERVPVTRADENLVALADEHRVLNERIVPLETRRREIESHPDFEKARALRARR
jgi:hypothetical protein